MFRMDIGQFFFSLQTSLTMAPKSDSSISASIHGVNVMLPYATEAGEVWQSLLTVTMKEGQSMDSDVTTAAASTIVEAVQDHVVLKFGDWYEFNVLSDLFILFQGILWICIDL